MPKVKRPLVPRPPPVPHPPPPAPPTPGAWITKDTPWRSVGLVLPLERWREILEGYPLKQDLYGIYAEAKGRVLPLAQSWMESNYAQSDNAYRLKNPLGLMEMDGRTPMRFNSFSEAFREWARRMDDPDYKGGVYRRDATLEEYTTVYVGGPRCWTTRGRECANGESWESCQRYLSETVARLNRYFGLRSTPSPTSTPSSDGLIPLGRVPKPTNYYERIIAPNGVNTAFDWVERRVPRGLVLHRMLGHLRGTDEWFRTGARTSALTDFGIGAGGQVYRWTQPDAAIAPYASGTNNPANLVASGDGIAFVKRYGWRMNPDCEAIEIEGLRYTDPVPLPDYQRLVELVAWRADAWLRIPYPQWPLNNDGIHCLLVHREFQNEKICPGEVVMRFVPQLIQDVRARLEHFQ